MVQVTYRMVRYGKNNIFILFLFDSVQMVLVLYGTARYNTEPYGKVQS